MKRDQWRVRVGASLLAAVLGLIAIPAQAEAQYFGRNKVQYDRFDFKILKTEHFDIYYYSEEAEAAATVGRLAERWHTRLSRVFKHALTGRQPVVLYASHPEFQQTNVIEGAIGEGTGGVTEGAKRRVILPMAATLAETDHVLGHELVHAFQYDMLGENIGALPLWFVEGMAEYLSIGARSPQTAMWLRDAAVEDRLPRLQDLDNPRFFPYRFGHAFWAYVAGRWGDELIGRVMQAVASPRAVDAAGEAAAESGAPVQIARNAVELIELATGQKRDDFSAAWHASIRETYGVGPAPTRNQKVYGTIIGERTGSGSMNVGPALSPDGTKVAFLSEKDRLSIDLFLADATTGKVIRKLLDTAADPHFESLQFLASAGAWDPTSQLLAIGTIRGGRPVLAIIDTTRGGIKQEIKFEAYGEIFHPAWSPDGHLIAFSGQVGGVTDLFVHDLRSGQTRRLTNDAFADLQPAWSPDGARLAFVTDRNVTDLTTLAFGGYRMATIAIADGAISPIDTGVPGNAINPQWSRDGESIFFVADAGGIPNAWRVDLRTKQATQLTDEVTGVSGITALSPALSVATATSRAAIAVFRDSGYEIQIVDPQVPPVAIERPTRVTDYALLPPIARASTVVDDLLAEPKVGLPPTTEKFEEEPYKPKLELVGIGQQIGVSTNSQFGTYVSGGIALQFSDLLGNHLLGTGFSVDGGVKDIAASVTYLNRTSRWNWGLFGERVPLLSGTIRQGFDTIQGQPVFVEESDLLRQTYLQAGALTAYPLSRSTRVEFSTAARHIGFDREVKSRYFDPFTGEFLGEDTTQLPADESIGLFDVSAAVVRDTSVFGATSPILGQRLRVEFAPTFGDIQMNNFTADLRHYAMPVRPVTLAGRLLHFGRYGAGSEDPRLPPLFLGYSTLVRGYDPNSFEASECSVTLDGSCPEFDRLFGSRLMVVQLEARAPVVGLFTGKLDYGPLPVELVGFFDAGVAWSKGDPLPLRSNALSDWVSSAGIGARVNLFGYIIAEFNMARPLNRPSRGWFFVFNLRPGF